MIKFIIILLLFYTIVYCDGHFVNFKEYDSVEIKNQFSDTSLTNNKLIGRWISEDDSGSNNIDNYGFIFTNNEYVHHTIYRFGKLWKIEYKGKGQWKINKNRLLINCSLVRTKYEYDSTKLFGNKIEVDTSSIKQYSMKYHFENDSTICFYWKTDDKEDIMSIIRFDFIDEQIEIKCKKECYKKINSKGNEISGLMIENRLMLRSLSDKNKRHPDR